MVFWASAIPATAALLITPVTYLLGYFEDFINVNFHLFIVLAMFLAAVPTGFAAASAGDALVEKNRHGGIGFSTANDRCKSAVEAMCSAKESGTGRLTDYCQNPSAGVQIQLESEGYTIIENGTGVMIECPT
jgi:hypothetical protein